MNTSKHDLGLWFSYGTQSQARLIRQETQARLTLRRCIRLLLLQDQNHHQDLVLCRLEVILTFQCLSHLLPILLGVGLALVEKSHLSGKLTTVNLQSLGLGPDPETRADPDPMKVWLLSGKMMIMIPKICSRQRLLNVPVTNLLLTDLLRQPVLRMMNQGLADVLDPGQEINVATKIKKSHFP